MEGIESKLRLGAAGVGGASLDQGLGPTQSLVSDTNHL